MSAKDGRIVTVRSLYGYKTRQPLVSLTVQGHDETTVTLSTVEARDIAQHLIEAAEAAEGDQFIFEFAAEKLGGDSAGALVLSAWREFREGQKT